jgi:hypothetical protein
VEGERGEIEEIDEERAELSCAKEEKWNLKQAVKRKRGGQGQEGGGEEKGKK